MKLKKILALASALVLSVSVFASTAIVADAAVDGATATLEFVGYETKGAATFAVINVKATIPDTLVPYKVNAADWVNTFEDTYEGKMLQSVGFDIPYVDGLAYVGSLSSAASYVQITDNTVAKKVIVNTANTGAYDTYYAGSIDTLATLYFRITGDVNATYDVKLTDAVIGLVEITDPTKNVAIPKEYTFADFTVANATVKPAVADEPTAETVAAWDTGDSLLVIGKLLKADAAVYGVRIKDYELPAEATVKAGPDFPALAANPASEAGYYGINIIGIAAGDYEVAAYADGVYDAYTSVTVE